MIAVDDRHPSERLRDSDWRCYRFNEKQTALSGCRVLLQSAARGGYSLLRAAPDLDQSERSLGPNLQTASHCCARHDPGKTDRPALAPPEIFQLAGASCPTAHHDGKAWRPAPDE